MNSFDRYLLKLFRIYFTGKKNFQSFFNLTRNLSLQGLNYSNGCSIVEGGESALMKQLAKKNTDSRTYIVCDVGANRGDYSAELIKNMQVKDLQIWCFEPSKDTFKKLHLN